MSDLNERIVDGIAILELNRPDRLNALSEEMTAGLLDALPRLDADPTVGAIVLTGAGRGFCAGGDVKAMAGRAERTFEERLATLHRAHRIPLLLRTMTKVAIAMINGPAAGAGLALAMACDFRIASSEAKFTTAFVGVGFSGDYGGSWTLTRLVGSARAKELYLLGDTIDASRAEAIGLVTRVVEPGRLHAETFAFARRLVEGPRLAYGYIKRNLFAAETEPFTSVLDLEAVHQARTGTSEDHREAARAFAERRTPVFKGR